MYFKEYQEEMERVSKANIEYEKKRQKEINRVLLWANIQRLLFKIRGEEDV